MDNHDQSFEIAAIVAKKINGGLTAAEQQKLDEWLAQDAVHQHTLNKLLDKAFMRAELDRWNDHDVQKGWADIKERITGRPAIVKPMKQAFWKYAAVAIPFMLLAGSGYLFYRQQQHGHPPAPKPESIASAKPGSKPPRLILADGQAIDLKHAQQGLLTTQQGTPVQLDNGKLVYQGDRAKDAGAQGLAFNTVQIPNGGEYQLVLPDGTKVWLNAATDLRFPVRFAGADRKVFLTGEAYFEVAKDASHPFIVESPGTTIMVLGTKFNLKSYPDEPSEKTTLTEGHVRLTANRSPSSQADLFPGSQGVLGSANGHITVGAANVSEALAWKSGLFVFDGETMESIMRKLSRWYDVDVKFEDAKLKQYHFTGRVSRQQSVEQLIGLINNTAQIKITLQQRTLIIAPI